MPFADATFTATVLPLAAESVTVRVAVVEPELPSVAVASLIDNEGAGSSSVIITVPCASEMVAFVEAVRLTRIVSLFSSGVSLVV